MKLMPLFVFALTGLAHASIEQAPPSFDYKGGRAVFVDFTDAHYEISYDLNAKTVTVESVIDFESMEEGHPVFDLVADPLEVVVDGKLTSAPLGLDPHQETLYRILQDKLAPGHHQLKIKHSLTTNVVWNEIGVASAFWLSDLTDRRYLEQYLPSNFEFDQHRRQFKVNLIGANGLPHVLKANGKISQREDGFDVVFPEFYTNSSVYFHLYPEKSGFQNVQFYYPSINGRMLPVDIYTSVDITPFIHLTEELLAELERDYGPYPHDQLIIYGNSLVKGGMEYSGATITGLLSLGHELFHSYNARGVMPANGNAGWMDEGMARWRDNGYPEMRNITVLAGNLSGHSVYRRYTDRNSYSDGSAFLSKLAHLLTERGLSLKVLIKQYFQKFMYTTVTTEQFEKELSELSGVDLSAEFKRYIYEKAPGHTNKTFKLWSLGPDHHHPKWSDRELLELTLPH